MSGVARAVAIAVLLLCAVITSTLAPGIAHAQRPSGEVAGADSSAVHRSGSLRGTVDPLGRQVSPLRHVARAPLWVGYTSFRVVTWPLEQLAYLNERHRLISRTANLFTWNFGSYESLVGPAVTFESSTGLTMLGATVSTEDWLGTGARLKVSGSYISDSKSRVLARIRTPEGPLSLELLGDLERVEDRPFYGIGPDTRDDRAAEDQRTALLEGSLRSRPVSWLNAVLTGYVRDIDLDPPSNDDPVTEIYPELSDLVELTEESQYVGIEASVAVDTRNGGEYSSGGGLLRLTAGTNGARSAAASDYNHYGAEAQYFINLYHHTRVLAFRVFAEGIDAANPGSVPYTELARVGGRTGLRGYSRYRFTDRNQLIVTAEYRYRVTQLFQGRVFADWGSVASEMHLLRLADIDPIFGAALAVASPRVPLVIQVSRSPETIEVYVGLSQVFGEKSRRSR